MSDTQANLRVRKNLPPVTVNAPAGTQQQLVPVDSQQQQQQPTSDSPPLQGLSVCQPPLSSRPLAPLPPLSPVQRGGGAVPRDDNDEAAERHGHIVNQIEGVIQKHDEREARGRGRARAPEPRARRLREQGR